MKRFFLFGLLLFACIGLWTMPPAFAAGNTVAIELPANPTTGYSWTYKMSAEDILQEESSTFLPSRGSDDKVGKGGKQVWLFRAVNSGSVSITFTYQRPWEDNSGSSDSVTYFYAVDNSLTITMIGRSSSSTRGVRPAEDNRNML